MRPSITPLAVGQVILGSNLWRTVPVPSLHLGHWRFPNPSPSQQPADYVMTDDGSCWVQNKEQLAVTPNKMEHEYATILSGSSWLIEALAAIFNIQFNSAINKSKTRWRNVNINVQIKNIMQISMEVHEKPTFNSAATHLLHAKIDAQVLCILYHSSNVQSFCVWLSIERSISVFIK